MNSGETPQVFESDAVAASFLEEMGRIQREFGLSVSDMLLVAKNGVVTEDGVAGIRLGDGSFHPFSSGENADPSHTIMAEGGQQ